MPPTLFGQNQSLSGRLAVRIGVIVVLLYLISSWLLPNHYTPTLFGDDTSLDESLYSSSISPLQIELAPFGDALTLQLPPHASRRWSLLHKVFTHFNPGDPLYTSFENINYSQPFAEEWKTCKRPDLINLSTQLVSTARNKHSSLVKTLPTLARAITFEKKSRGIVTTANTAFMPVLLVSLRLLRRTGCTLPVEVFISKLSEYEPKLCEKVLPYLNAKCILLADDVVDGEPPADKPSLESYQIKPFVLLLSSFSEVLFLDADNFPVIDPESLFLSEAFRDTGLIIWPDFWCATQSHFFYKVTGAIEPSIESRPASESGQLMYDKSRHIEDLLLACYYGYYGPGLWYPLLSQGYPGEGDKETYLAAAMVMNATYYQVRQLPGMLPGDYDVDFAIQQADPAHDYAAMKKGVPWDELDLPHAFIHHHYPKLNATQMMYREDYEWARGKHDRMWGSPDNTEQYGLDLEHEVWKAVNYTACDLGSMFKTWDGLNSSCEFVQHHMQLVFKDQTEKTGKKVS